MKKKTSKKSEAPIKEVVEQAVEQIKEAAAAAEAKPKQRKMVEFKVLASIMEKSRTFSLWEVLIFCNCQC